MWLSIYHAQNFLQYNHMLLEVSAEHDFHSLVSKNLFTQILCFLDLLRVV